MCTLSKEFPNFTVKIHRCDREALFIALNESYCLWGEDFVLQFALDLSRSSTKADNYDTGQDILAV